MKKIGNNICYKSDSYKVGGHWNMLPPGTTNTHAYFESRPGAKWDKTVFFGLQAILEEHLCGRQVTLEKIQKAKHLVKCHFGDEKFFNEAGWMDILNNHNGELPIVIKAVPEGTVVPVNNVLMTVEATDEKHAWLVNYLETILSQVWYPCTVATLSREVKKVIFNYLAYTSDKGLLDFMLHDFGYRGVSSYESAALGAAAHLVNFKGTDTIAGMELAEEYYHANLETLAYSVAATEHRIMTAEGNNGEAQVLQRLLNTYTKGILSVVADSYNIYNFVEKYVCDQFKQQILEREGLFVIRPDSVTPTHRTPEEEMLWIVDTLYKQLPGGYVNSKRCKVINDKVRVLWGDGIDDMGIENILYLLAINGYAAENIACFGMGGGLLQKVNRDTQRFAFKCSAQLRNGVWEDVQKLPLDQSKKSKAGRLKLVKVKGAHGSAYATVSVDDPRPDVMVEVFNHGKLVNPITFDEVRKNAQL